MKPETILIIKCHKLNDFQLGFYCPYCKMQHRHGRAKGYPNGWRVSHCINPKSPYFDKEYYIEEVQE